MWTPSQGWRTFLRNHAPNVAAMDLFIVPTIGFDLLYDPQSVQEDGLVDAIQKPGFRVVARESLGESTG